MSSHFTIIIISTSDDLQPALTQVLPLFNEKAATAAMIKLGMNVHDAQFLNPEQVIAFGCTTVCMDRPSLFGGTGLKHMVKIKYVVMLGGLHIEMAKRYAFGDYT